MNRKNMLRYILIGILLISSYCGHSSGYIPAADTLVFGKAPSDTITTDSVRPMSTFFNEVTRGTITYGPLYKDTTTRNSIFRRIYRYFMESNEVKEDKKFDFSIIGGPHFASDTKLGLGVVASGLYRTDRSDLSIQPSNISLYGDITTTGYYLLGVRGTTIFPQDRYRLELNLYFFSFPLKYWGIGYDNARKDHTNYKRLENKIRIDFSRRTFKNTYLGVTAMYCYVNGKDFKDISFLEGAKSKIKSAGIGFFLTYDSRDFIPNPYRGTYARFEQVFFPKFANGDYAFKRSEIAVRQYNRLWKGCILALDLQGTFNYGDIPWTMIAQMGSAYQMRGYYEGQYQDKNLIQTQVELRQHIYNRHGVAAWGGAGNVFPSFFKFKWAETLPTYGIGYRWEFKNRINIRLDYGFGKGQSAFYFNINEAF